MKTWLSSACQKYMPPAYNNENFDFIHVLSADPRLVEPTFGHCENSKNATLM